MSMFMPDGTGQSQPSSGVANITPADSETTSADVALMQRVLSAASRNPNLIPPDFMAYVLDWIQTQRLTIPIGQVFGFSQFTAQIAPTIATQESTTSSAYTDLATVGPELTGLGNGKYLVLFGAIVNNNTSGAASMSIQANSSSAADDDRAYSEVAGFNVSVMRAVNYALTSGDNNTLTAKYHGDGTHSSFWESRWLVALKYTNL